MRKLVTVGWADTVKPGETFTIRGAFAINPQSRQELTFVPSMEPCPRTAQLDLGKHCFRVEFFGRARDERERAGMPPFMFRSTLLGALVEAKAGGWVTDLRTGQILPA